MLGAEPAGEGEEESRFVPDSEGFVEIVWIVADGRAEARQVKTGIQNETTSRCSMGSTRKTRS